MASVSNDKDGTSRVLFFLHGKRKAVRLGRVPARAAAKWRDHVEALARAREDRRDPPRETAGWLADLGAKGLAKLARAGLVDPAAAPPADAPLTVGRLVEEFLAARTDVKPGTRVNLDLAGRDLAAFLGAGKPVAAVTEADAEAFMRHQLGEPPSGRGLAPNTARRRAGRARQFFAWAVRRRLIAANPFSGLKVATRGNPDRQVYVPAGTIREVIDAAPSAEWRLIIALSRFAGLRCPSEHLALAWADVLWDRMRFVVRSPKTGDRVVPIFPEIEPYLRECFDLAEPGQVHVITRNRGDGRMGNAITTNWRTQMMRIVRRAGVTPWPKLFHNLRASCQTDLTNRLPAHVVCAWLGNSVAVANEHYLQVTDEHFRRALEKAAHYPAHSEKDRDGLGGTGNEETPAGQGICPPGSSVVPASPTVRMTPRGSEQPSVSERFSHVPAGPGARPGALAQILALIEGLTPAERAEALAALEALP